jgi:uncharacterized phiE125 gp8 family phage protein
MELRVVTGPSTEPVTTAYGKAHTRIDLSDEDTNFALYLKAARILFERLTGLQLMSAQYRLYLDTWESELLLPRPPLITLDHIKYYASTVLTTLSSSTYYVDSYREPARVRLTEFPSVDTYSKIEVTFTSGYASADAVPELIKQAICLQAAYWFANRESDSPGIDGFMRIVNMYKCGFEFNY